MKSAKNWFKFEKQAAFFKVNPVNPVCGKPEEDEKEAGTETRATQGHAWPQMWRVKNMAK